MRLPSSDALNGTGSPCRALTSMTTPPKTRTFGGGLSGSYCRGHKLNEIVYASEMTYVRHTFEDASGAPDA